MTHSSDSNNPQPTPETMYRQLCKLSEDLQFIRMDMQRLQEIGAPLVVDFSQIARSLEFVRAMQKAWLDADNPS